MAFMNSRRLGTLTPSQIEFLESEAGDKTNHELAEELHRLHEADFSPRNIAYLRLQMDLPPEPGKLDPRHGIIMNNPDLPDEELARRIQRAHKVGTTVDDVAVMREKIADAAGEATEAVEEIKINDEQPAPNKRTLTAVPREDRDESKPSANQPTSRVDFLSAGEGLQPEAGSKKPAPVRRSTVQKDFKL